MKIAFQIVGLTILVAAILARVAVPDVAWAQSRGASETTPQPAPERVVLRFLTEDDFPPFNYLDEDNVLTGFNIDLARALCLDLNVTCDIKTAAWDELLTKLNRGEADAVIAGHRLSASLVAQVPVTNQYFQTPARFAGLRGGATLEISPEGLERKRIGVAKGTAHEAYLRTFFRDSQIVEFPTPDLARQAMQQKKVDFVFDDAVSLVFWLNGILSKACCEFKGEPFAEPRFFGQGMTIAVSPRDEKLREDLNRGLQRVRENGRYEELMLRYFPLRAY